jgi:hypothetical protein
MFWVATTFPAKTGGSYRFMTTSGTHGCQTTGIWLSEKRLSCPAVTLHLKLGLSWNIIFICAVKTIILSLWLTKAQYLFPLPNPENERSRDHVERCESTEGGNREDQ